MVPLLTSSASPLSHLVLELVPEVYAAPTHASRRDTVHDGLLRVTSALEGDSFALLQFTAEGTFDVRLASGFASRALAGRSVTDGHLLLRRFAASRLPTAVSRAHQGAPAATLGELGVGWALGLPARSPVRSRGVLVVTGRNDRAPQAAELRWLAALSGPLASVLDASCADQLPATDPTEALRRAGRQARRRAMWREALGAFGLGG